MRRTILLLATLAAPLAPGAQTSSSAQGSQGSTPGSTTASSPSASKPDDSRSGQGAPDKADQAAAPAKGKPGKPEKKPLPRESILEEVVGKVASVDRPRRRITVDTQSGPVELTLDRNTLVYVARGLGTVADIAPGLPVRAGRNADNLAYWVAVKPGATEPRTSPTAAQGSSATRAAGPPPPEAGPPASPAAPPSPGPGATTPGPEPGTGKKP